MTAFGKHIEGKPHEHREGGYQLTSLRLGTGWGIPVTGTYDSLTSDDYFELAKLGRVALYQRVKSEVECLKALKDTGSLVQVSFEITEQWLKYETQIELDVPGDEYIGVHCLNIVGFDEQEKVFHCLDMRHTEDGPVDIKRRLPFGFFNRYLVDAWVVDHNPKLLYHFWESPNLILYGVMGGGLHLGGDTFAFHLYDKKNDDLFAWIMATAQSGFLNIEDFFVKPEWRGKGIGQHLLSRVLQVCRELKLEPSFWIPWTEHKKEDRAAFDTIAKKLGMFLEPSKRRWAAYRCHRRADPNADLTLSWIPELAGLTEPVSPDIAASLTEAWTDKKNERRLELIDLKYNEGISQEQQTELSLLQVQLSEFMNKTMPLPFDVFKDHDDIP